MCLTSPTRRPTADGGCVPRLVAALLLPVVAACGDPSERRATLELSGATMGTRFSVQVVARPAAVDRRGLQNAIDAALAEIEGRLSTYRPDSEISRFNARPATDWMRVSPETCRLVERALDIGRRTGGAFDVTVAPLVEAWGFGAGPATEQPLPAEAIAALLDSVGAEWLDTDCALPALRKRKPGLGIDLSAFAKGHAVDRVAGILDAEGLADYLVEIGGEVRAAGRSARGDPWRVAVEHPLGPGRPPVLAVPLEDRALATSGDYRNYFEADGRRYSHTIDPRNGYPVRHALASVSVLAATAAEADALATALLVLGPERGAELAERHSIAALFLIRAEVGLEQRSSPAFRRILGASAGGAAMVGC